MSETVMVASWMRWRKDSRMVGFALVMPLVFETTETISYMEDLQGAVGDYESYSRQYKKVSH